MSEQTPQQDNQEIDLGQISKKIGSFFNRIENNIFRFIFFIKKNILIFGMLFILGVVLGYFLDKESKNYVNEIIVQPNFSSNDYLYSKIALLNSKIETGDTVFLKKIGIDKPKKIGKVEIEPITDIYPFISDKEVNFEFIKLMAEDGNIEKIIKDEVTSKNYHFHKITFNNAIISTDKNTITPIMNFLNDSDYYKKIQKQCIINLKEKISQNDSILLQINGILDSFSKKDTSNKSFYYNESTQLNEVIKSKDQFENQRANRKIELINSDKIIKDISTITNIKEKEPLYTKMKVLLPLFFMTLFILIYFFRKRYQKNQSTNQHRN